jgi:hypothetical protein
MREHLIGYLLGALDASEQKLVEEQLERDPQLREELELLSRSLSPLEADVDGYEPPDGLADETIELVASFGDLDEADEFHKAFESEPTHAPPPRMAPLTQPTLAPPAARRSWITLADVLVSAGVCAVAAALFFPAIAQSRHQAQLAACQDRLQAIGRALAAFADNHQGEYPAPPDDGPLAVAGYYSLPLREDGYLPDDADFLCPGGTLDEAATRLPLREELLTASDARLIELQRRLGGSFGYNLGVMIDGERHPVQRQGRNLFAIMSDAPSVRLGGRQSSHHGGDGQNVLFDDGGVRFVRGFSIGEFDDLFHSDRGFVEAGRHVNDSVIGRSEAAPIIWVRGR